ncbi:helix-turn-helix transcriptional regulator [Saccharopolyspora sp. ID03-671]|uniref:helix-turn-helix domain-containing protein n=1 Tax=Saccharopolyspora sp. ID03-671 TaxID=3073066 RepID=UPI003249048D
MIDAVASPWDVWSDWGSGMVDQLALDVGDRVRFHRLASKKTQVVIAGLAGITTDYLYQIERGKKLPTVAVLVLIANALGVPPASLIQGSPREPVSQTHHAAGEALHRAMTLPPAIDAEPLPVTDLRVQINKAWWIWQSSPTRYSQVSRLLPRLIGEVEQLLGPASDAGHLGDGYRAAADLYGLTRTVAKRTGRVDLALLAADRSLRAARASGDARRIGAAHWNLAHAALAEGHHDVAEDIAMTAAEELRNSSGPEPAAVHGSLILVAGVAAVRRRALWTARERIRSVAPVAWKTAECNTLWTAFGPTNVAMHTVSIEAEAGETRQASELAESIDYERSPSIERRVAFLLEQARAFQRSKDYGSALVILQSAARDAPEDVAYRPAAQSVLNEVIRNARRTTAKEAARLADRLGIHPD